MSQQQAFNPDIGPVGPDLETLTTADGTVVGASAAHNINLLAGETSANFDAGITTTGNAGTNTTNVLLTNRQTSQVTTTDATPSLIISLPLGTTPGCYHIWGECLAYNTTDIDGACYNYDSGFLTSGAAATQIAVSTNVAFKGAAMTTATISVAASGNNAQVTITGIAGKTIDWNCTLNYRFIS